MLSAVGHMRSPLLLPFLLLLVAPLLSVADSQVSNDTVVRNAGIYFRLNQKAVDYISELASDGLPQLLKNLSPPDIKVSMASISKTLVHEVTRPDIKAKFIGGKGVRANISLPYVRLSSHAKVSVFFFEYAGGFMVDVHNLTIGMEIHYSRNETTQRNLITSPYCEVTHSDVQFVFDKDSQLNTLRGELKDGIISGVRTAVCETALEALQFIDDQNVQAAAAPSVPEVAEVAEMNDGTEFDAAELGASLCQTEVLAEDVATSTTTTTVSPTELMANATGAPAAALWGVDLSLVYPPRFTDDDVVFGVDGGVLLNGVAAADVEAPLPLDTAQLNEKMVGILLSEYIPNTLFSHIYDRQLGSIHERFSPEHLPKAIRKPARMLCSGCFLDVKAHLTDKPYVHIDKDLGARVRLSANVTVQFQGRQDLHDLIHATTTLHVTLKPTIRHSRVYGDVSLTSVDVDVKDLGVGGAFAGPLEKVISVIVPRVLWPQVKKRLRFAINRRGIQLPVMCGVELEHLSLSYIDRAIVANTDFTFDIPLFVRKFRRYLRYKSSINAALPKYID